MIITIEPIEREDCHFIVEWNQDQGESYLHQWAGPKVYHYPLDAVQISSRIEAEETTVIFKILDSNDMIGSIELADMDRVLKTGKICRFILRREVAGKGIGQRALTALVEYAFERYGLECLSLNVFTFNVSAIKCYEKVGFRIVEETKNPENPRWDVYRMTKNK